MMVQVKEHRNPESQNSRYPNRAPENLRSRITSRRDRLHQNPDHQPGVLRKRRS